MENSLMSAESIGKVVAAADMPHLSLVAWLYARVKATSLSLIHI